MTAGNIVPILSICIPTYNRASSLRNLFRSLRAVKLQFPSEIEICISNNASPDDTAAVIAEHQDQLDLKVVHQTQNLGATLNIIAVTKMMSGHWGLLVGDDDELIPAEFGEFLNYLATIDRNDWVLVEAQNLEGGHQYLRQFKEREYHSAAFCRQLLKKGMYSLGFMGINVFPLSAVSAFNDLTVETGQPWPQVAVLLRRLVEAKQKVSVLKKAVVAQAKGGAVLFWNGGDLARIKLGKIRVLMHVYRQHKRSFFFLHLMMLRELFEPQSIRALMAWKLYEGEDYDKNAVSTYLRCYSWLGLFLPLTIPHAALMLLLRILPHSAYARCFKLVGLGYLLSRYQALKNELGTFDAIKRGL
jgi:glycosyltransferase involved in cell wall biosynthesis